VRDGRENNSTEQQLLDKDGIQRPKKEYFFLYRIDIFVLQFAFVYFFLFKLKDAFVLISSAKRASECNSSG